MALCTAAVFAVAVAAPALVRAHPVEGRIFYSRYLGNPNIGRATFAFDGQTLAITDKRPVASVAGADGLAFAPDGRLIVGGQGDVIHALRLYGSRAPETVSAGGASAFHIVMGLGGGRAWAMGTPGPLVEIPLDPFADGIPRMLTGDDRAISSMAFGRAGSVYYTTGNDRGAGHFGALDLDNFTTRRLLSNLPAAHHVTFDSMTGDLFLFGGAEILQIDPDRPHEIKSRLSFGKAARFDQGTPDGEGHLFVARVDGMVVFVDFASTGRVGDPANAIRIVFLDSNLDDLAPLSGPGARGGPRHGSGMAREEDERSDPPVGDKARARGAAQEDGHAPDAGGKARVAEDGGQGGGPSAADESAGDDDMGDNAGAGEERGAQQARGDPQAGDSGDSGGNAGAGAGSGGNSGGTSDDRHGAGAPEAGSPQRHGAAMAADANSDAADSPATGRKSSKGTGSGSTEGPPGPDGAGGGGEGADADSPLSSSGGIAQQGLIVLLLTLAASLGLRLGGPRGPVLSWTIYAGGAAAAGPGYTIIRYFEFLLEGGRPAFLGDVPGAIEAAAVAVFVLAGAAWLHRRMRRSAGSRGRSQAAVDAAATVIDEIDSELARGIALTGSRIGFVGRFEPGAEPGDLTLVATRDGTAGNGGARAETRLTPEQLGLLLDHREVGSSPIFVSAARDESVRRWLPKPLPEVKALMAVPIVADGEPVGLLGLANSPHHYDDAAAAKVAPVAERLSELLAGMVPESVGGKDKTAKKSGPESDPGEQAAEQAGGAAKTKPSRGQPRRATSSWRIPRGR